MALVAGTGGRDLLLKSPCPFSVSSPKILRLTQHTHFNLTLRGRGGGERAVFKRTSNLRSQ